VLKERKLRCYRFRDRYHCNILADFETSNIKLFVLCQMSYDKRVTHKLLNDVVTHPATPEVIERDRMPYAKKLMRGIVCDDIAVMLLPGW
jgi:hypothetical protein